MCGSEKQALRGYVGGIQRFSTEDGPGIRTTVFLKGCPLRCQWCHNPELIGSGQDLMRTDSKCIGCGRCAAECPQHAISPGEGKFVIDRQRCDLCMECTEACPARALRRVARRMTVGEVMEEANKDRSYYLASGGGLTISGGELLGQPKFAFALLRAANAEGYGVALDTSGCGDGEILLSMARECEYILYDIKTSVALKHREYTGAAMEPIRRNLEKLAADPSISGKIIVRMPLISGVNDDLEDIALTRNYLVRLGLKEVALLPYHDLGVAKSRGVGREARRFSTPTQEHLHRLKDEFTRAGIHTVIGGENN